jgi:hypothetical protein
MKRIREPETLEQLVIFRGLMADLLPHMRHKSANRNYRFAMPEVSTRARAGKVIVERKPAFVPYVAVGHPPHNEFGNPYENMTRFFMHVMPNKTTTDGSDTSLVLSNATRSAQLIDIFFKKRKDRTGEVICR